jgi:hypothetical protein
VQTLNENDYSQIANRIWQSYSMSAANKQTTPQPQKTPPKKYPED